MNGLKPDAVVLVATVKALKYNGGVPKTELGQENLEALKKGIVNLEKHIENLQKYQVPVVVTLNRFITDTDAELAFVEKFCKDRNCDFALANVWEKGGEGGIELANAVLNTLENKKSDFKVLYKDELSIKEKISCIATEIYGAANVTYSPEADRRSLRLKRWDLETSLYVWQRISIHFRMIQRSLEDRKDLILISVKYMSVQVPALWSRSQVRS